MSNARELLVLPEPLLIFGYGQQLEHPKDGLLLYGPYFNPHKGGQIRIGLIGTKEGAERYGKWVQRLSKVIAPKKANDPNHTVFPGFQAVFQTEWAAEPTVYLPVDSNQLHLAICMEDRHQAIYKAVSLYADSETTLTPNEFTKSNGMPMRLLQDPATLAWNLATTVFFKIGGQPWKLSTPRPGVCYVGIVFKRETLGADENNACCGAQMFLDSGDGVVFRGAVGPWYSPTNKQFHLTREKARELMTLIVKAYKNCHGGDSPSELFIHGKTRFLADEWEGFRETVPENCHVACVRIREDQSLKLFRLGLTNIPRGLAWVESTTKGHLWSKGFIPRLQTYPGREVPNPLSIEIVRGEADINVVMIDVLALTKLNYNTCIYSDGVPVTLRFADTIGEILTAGPMQHDLPPLPFRYYI